MKYTEQDREDYIKFLQKEIKEENKQPKTIAKMYNLIRLNEDLKGMK